MAIVTNFSTSSSIKDALSYGSNSEKLGYTVALNCSKNPSEVVNDFELPFKINARDNDRVKLNRFVISFANDNDGKSELNQFDANNYVRDFLFKFNDEFLHNQYPIIAFEHLNTNYNHYHLYFPSLSIDGKKFHPKLNPMYQVRKINDALAREYHLKSIQSYKSNFKHQFTQSQLFNYSKKHNGRLPYSYKDHARYVLSNAVVHSNNLRDFDLNMHKFGCGIAGNFYSNNKVGSIFIPFIYKNFKHKNNQNFRKVRTKTLGNDFTKDKLKLAITSNDSKILDKYKCYLKKPPTVTGGQYFDYYKKHFYNNDFNNMRGVNFKDERLNFAKEIKFNTKKSSNLQKKVDSNSRSIDKNSKQAINQSRDVHKDVETKSRITRKAGRRSSKLGELSFKSPEFKELDSEDKQELIAFTQFLETAQKSVDILSDDIANIAHNASNLLNKPLYKSYNKVFNQHPEMKFDYFEKKNKVKNLNQSQYKHKNYQQRQYQNANYNASINNINRNRRNLKNYDNIDQSTDKSQQHSNQNKWNPSIVPDGVTGKEFLRKFKQHIHDKQVKRRKDAKEFNRKFDAEEKERQNKRNLRNKQNMKRKRQILQYRRNNRMNFH